MFVWIRCVINRQRERFPWMRNIFPYGITAFSFLFALCFCVAFFWIAGDLPETVPLHWSEQGGYDRWGPKAELYPITVIPTVIALITLPCSILSIRKDLRFLSYFANGISIFSTAMTILAAAMLLAPV